MKKRPLNENEKRFVNEAEEGGFTVGYDADGNPYALGAEKTDNLFSMDVTEVPERDGGSCYTLKV